MKRILFFIATVCWLPISLFAQGFSPSYDHSVSISRLSEPGQNGHAIPFDLPLPAYPPEMLRLGLNGEVKVKFLVQEDGSVSDVEIVSSNIKEFVEPTLKAVKQWKFKVYDLQGHLSPQRLWVRYQIAYSLADN